MCSRGEMDNGFVFTKKFLSADYFSMLLRVSRSRSRVLFVHVCVNVKANYAALDTGFGLVVDFI